MLKTGQDLKSIYRETSQGGLAREMAYGEETGAEEHPAKRGEKSGTHHRMRPQC
jgi:hypothetical protein